MVTTGAILFGDKDRHLRFHEAEHPVALQLGGSEAPDLAECTKIAAGYGYDEVNLNCGCPSDRVQRGRFGACLMKEPDTVARCVEAMAGASGLPVTVKCRIGVDGHDDYAFLDDFVRTVSTAGCRQFVIHARKAWLQGLSPKENREKPPLCYERVAEIKAAYPQLEIILNGGIESVKSVQDNLERFDGVMIGRAAYQTPYFLAGLEREVFGNPSVMSRAQVVQAMIPYLERQQKDHGVPLHAMTRHMLGLFHGQPGGRIWRRLLTEGTRENISASALIHRTLEQMPARPLPKSA